jgi:hypothetical protein
MLNWLKGDKVDHPLADAKHAKAVIDAFPANDPRQALEDASHWLESIQTTEGFKLDKRFELVDALDTATRRAQRRLLDTYISLKSEEPIQERLIWNSVTNFWKLLADGYLACMAQARDSKNVGAAIKPQLPVIAMRATRALHQQLKWVMMRYGMVRPEIWFEIADCASFAEAGGFAEAAAEVYPGEAGSVRHELVRVVMFWASSPGGLSPVEQEIAERIIVHLTPRFAYSMVPVEGDVFCFDLGGKMPPLRSAASVPRTSGTRYIDTIEPRKAVQTMLASITSTGVIPSDLVLGPGAVAASAARVLRYLLFNWAMPKRASERRKTAMSLHIVHGYENVLAAVAPEFAAQGETLDFASAPVHESWIAQDASAGGYGLISPLGKGGWLKVGVLVGLRAENEKVWSVGIVRRVKSDQHKQLHAGIQLMSKGPVPVSLRLVGSGDSGASGDHAAKTQHALLLGAQPSPNGSLHIIAHRDIFSGNHQLDAEYGQPRAAVMLEAAGIIESGADFDWLRYRLCALDPMLMSLKLDLSGNT